MNESMDFSNTIVRQVDVFSGETHGALIENMKNQYRARGLLLWKSLYLDPANSQIGKSWVKPLKITQVCKATQFCMLDC